MNAAEIAARKAMLAALEAARVVMRDTVNAATNPLNAAVLAGDLALIPTVETLTPVVVALNVYKPKLLDAIAATDAMVPDDPPEPEPDMTPQDWATRSANRKLALPLMSAGPEDANLAGRHPRDARGIWTDNKNRPLPEIDAKGLRFDVVPGMGVPDWYTDLGQHYGPNSTMYAQWQMLFSAELLNTVFEMTGGGYPGIKLAVFSSLNATSDSQKLVVSTLNQWNLVYLYQYWQGATANLYANMPGTGGMQDIQPVVGQLPTCIYPAYAQAARGTTPPGCKGLPALKWVTFDIKVVSGAMIPGINACEAERWLWLTVGGVKTLIIHYGKDSPGYIGRNADPFQAIWLAPYMTNKSATQQHPIASVWHRELIVDDKPIPPAKFVESPPVIIPGTLPDFVPPPGTFAPFTLNTFYDARPPTWPNLNDAKRVLAHWNSAALISDYSARGGIAYHGGGEHGDGQTDSCGVMMLNLETRLYEHRCRATQQYTQATGKATDPHPTNEWAEHADGSPAAPHIYNQAVEWPKAWGGGPRGSFLRAGGTAGSSTVNGNRYREYMAQSALDPVAFPPEQAPVNGDNAFNCVHAFDVSKEILGVSRLAPQSGAIRYGSARDWGGNYAAACIDRYREGWWLKMGTSGQSLLAFLSKSGTVSYPYPELTSMLFPALRHITYKGQDVLLALYTGMRKTHMSLLDLATGTKWLAREPSGTLPALDALGTTSAVGHVAPRWCDSLECLVGLEYALAVPTLSYLVPSDPAKLMASSWEWRTEQIASADGGAWVPNDRVNYYGSGNGSFGKLIEVPEWKSWVFTKNATEPGILIRPRAMG